MEDLLRKIPGVLQTDVGYTGGGLKSLTYQDVSSGETGHAESVRGVRPEGAELRDAAGEGFFHA